jgi:hypothetical protein
MQVRDLNSINAHSSFDFIQNKASIPFITSLDFQSWNLVKLSIYMFLEYYVSHFSWIISQIFAIFFLKVSVINSAQRKEFQSLGKKDSKIIEPTKFR